MTAQMISAEFATCFDHQPDFVVRSPGRVNLIGDHTDYTGGWVLPIAIDRSVLVAARVVDPPYIDVHSAYLDQRIRILVDDVATLPDESWSQYIVGVVALLKECGIPLRGFELYLGGDLPPGAGLGSSASMEVGVAQALLKGVDKRLSPVALATLCRRAEQEYAKSPCGIMDQLSCTLARAEHALLIDCQSMSTEHIRLKLDGAALVVIDTGVRHSIARSEYPRRRRECAAALAAITDVYPSIASLRDIREDQIVSCAKHLDDTLRQRVTHVVTENARVLRAAEALRSSDLPTFGRLMNESHASLSDDFEVSCDELNDIVSIARSVDGVYGARMTGGGFGGCVIVLASSDSIPKLVKAVHESFDGRYASDATPFSVRAADAAGVLDDDRDV